MTDLDQLESQSVYILREAFNRIDRLAVLWSIGKDSNVLLWLARKAFFGKVPFPVVQLDTGMELPEVYEFRDMVKVLHRAGIDPRRLAGRIGAARIAALVWRLARLSRYLPSSTRAMTTIAIAQLIAGM